MVSSVVYSVAQRFTKVKIGYNILGEVFDLAFVVYCANYNFTEPTTEDACSAIDFCYWYDDDMEYGCQCECIGSWLFDLETGVTYCDETI